MASLASQVVQYTGGDTRLGRRVRIGAAVTLLAITLHTVVIIGVSGPPSCCSKEKKRSAIQEDLRKVGKAVAGDTAVESEGGRHEDFDEYDVVVVGGGMYVRIPVATWTTWDSESRVGQEDFGHELRSGIRRHRGLRPGVAPQRRA